jgi:hypothetical protein
VHEGEPDARCELAGAFAELKLSFVGVYTVANATVAVKATSNIDSAVKIPSRFMFLVLLAFPVG